MYMQLTDDIKLDVEGATDQRNTLNFIKFIYNQYESKVQILVN